MNKNSGYMFLVSLVLGIFTSTNALGIEKISKTDTRLYYNIYSSKKREVITVVPYTIQVFVDDLNEKRATMHISVKSKIYPQFDIAVRESKDFKVDGQAYKIRIIVRSFKNKTSIPALYNQVVYEVIVMQTNC